MLRQQSLEVAQAVDGRQRRGEVARLHRRGDLRAQRLHAGANARQQRRPRRHLLELLVQLEALLEELLVDAVAVVLRAGEAPQRQQVARALAIVAEQLEGAVDVVDELALLRAVRLARVGVQLPREAVVAAGEPFAVELEARRAG